jgi:hypothetical protein
LDNVATLGPARPKSPVRRSLDEYYRHYRLIAGKRGESFSAVAYAGRILAFSATAQDVDAALDRLKALIDGDFAERREQRSDAFPSEAEFERALALAERRLTGSHIHLLETLRDGNGEVHPLQLQRRAGVDEEMLMRDMARLARLIADILDVGLPKGAANVAAALDMIALDIALPIERATPWLFRPQFAAAAGSFLAR